MHRSLSSAAPPSSASPAVGGCSNPRKHLLRVLQREKPQTRWRMGLFFLLRSRLVVPPGWAFFFPVMQARSVSQSPNPPISTRGNKLAGLSHLVLIRMPGWEGRCLSQMRTFASWLQECPCPLLLCPAASLHPPARRANAGFASLPAAAPLAACGKGRVRWVMHGFALLSPSRSFQTST